MESASRQAVSEELKALGSVPNEAELSALIERYAGSRRVTCEQADLFFASIGEVKPARKSGAPRDAAEVARGSWLDKLGPRSSAPPRTAAASAAPPVLSIAAAPSVHPPEEPITIEQALEHLPAMTYSSAPPPSALPTEDSAPVALPLSSHPAPPLAAADSVVVERWGMAETTPEPVGDDSEEDALLDQWSDELDQAIAASEHPVPLAAAVEPDGDIAAIGGEDGEALEMSDDALAALGGKRGRALAGEAHDDVLAALGGEHDDASMGREHGAPFAADGGENEPALAGEAHDDVLAALGGDRREVRAQPGHGHNDALGLGEPDPAIAAAASEPARAIATDAPERWSAPHLGGEHDPRLTTNDDDAPLSAAELSLLDQWSTAGSSPPAAASGDSAPADTRRSSRAPKRTMPPPFRGASLRPAAAPPQPAAAAAVARDDAPLDVELEDEIEIDPDDLIEIDSE